MTARLIGERIDLVETLNRYRDEMPAGRDGAMACFIGSMRDMNMGDSVQAMALEHYPEMTQRFLDDLCAAQMSARPLNDILIVHRYGELSPGDDIVLVACWSAHRADAFDACREAMEALKSQAPFWKREVTAEGDRWVHDLQD